MLLHWWYEARFRFGHLLEFSLEHVRLSTLNDHW